LPLFPFVPVRMEPATRTDASVGEFQARVWSGVQF